MMQSKIDELSHVAATLQHQSENIVGLAEAVYDSTMDRGVIYELLLLVSEKLFAVEDDIQRIIDGEECISTTPLRLLHKKAA